MTADAYLQARDYVDLVAKKLQSGSVVNYGGKGYQHHIAHKRIGRFHVVCRITIGPRGGVYGMVYLWDSTIKPDADSIRIGEVPDFGRHTLLDLASLFWKEDKKTLPSKDAILNSMQCKIASLPSNEDFYQDLFLNGLFDTPSHSVGGFQGGAPGLKG